MSEQEQQRKRLSDDEMERIHTAIREGDWAYGVLETFKCFGVDLGEQGDAIRPYDYAIPEDQWGQIAQWCMDGADGVNDSRLTRVNHSLDWMNYGPSGYKEDE